VGPEDEAAASAELEPPNLSGLFAAPRWLRDTSAVTRIAADLARDRAETVTT
jgi:hypothetical protein